MRRALAGICLVALGFCATTQERDIPTGVERREIDGGVVELTVTARASENAIASGRFTQMQATSCQAAQDLLAYEMQQERYRDTRRNFRTQNMFLYRGAEYCQIVGIYDPRGHSGEERSIEPAEAPEQSQ